MRKEFCRIFLLTTSLVLLSNCAYEFPEPPYPRVETLEVAHIPGEGVRFQGNAKVQGDHTFVNHGFVWSALPRFLISNAERLDLGPISDPQHYQADVNDAFDPNVKYYVRAFVQTESHTVYGVPIEFVDRR
jgi:hypothetical protein